MTNTSENIPDIDDRFLEPSGWRWHHFTSNGRRLRFGSVFPEESIPDGTVVCLPGLSEYCEKYFEVAQDCLNRNLAFWVLDWAGQGKSDRYLESPHKRHSEGFQHDIEDLHAFILGYIKHSSVHPDKGRVPLVMLGHSMGANIGLHYLAQHPDIFECAAFSAPMTGIYDLKTYPLPLQYLITLFTALFAGKSYVHKGGHWDEKIRPSPGPDSFSSDPVRAGIHNAWCKADTDLQVGSPTYGWLFQAVKSCTQLSKSLLSSIKTPCFFALAENEVIVDNAQTKRIVPYLKNAEMITIEGARHEILMEQDSYRAQFFDAFDRLVKENVRDRPETLKPF